MALNFTKNVNKFILKKENYILKFKLKKLILKRTLNYQIYLSIFNIEL
mgnify:FL=1